MCNTLDLAIDRSLGFLGVRYQLMINDIITGRYWAAHPNAFWLSTARSCP